MAITAMPLHGQIWTQKGMDIDGGATGDRAGRSVSMPDSNTVAIGSSTNDGNGTDAGHVRVFRWNGSLWVQKGGDINGDTTGDASGFSVSMPDSNTVAIGSPGNGGNGPYAGHVRIFQWSGLNWIQKGTDIDGEAAYNYSGYSVSMPDPNTVAIGADRNSGNGTWSGHVRIYQWNGTGWVQKGGDIDGETAGDRSGRSVSMPDPNTVAIGAYLNDDNGNSAGHVRIFEWSGGAWVQKGADIDGESAGDFCGHSVSMPDANTVAVGAIRNSTTGTSAGQVRIFQWNGSAWIQKGGGLGGEAGSDYAGYSVSMPDANTVAVGARLNDGNGTDAGHVRIYRWTGGAWVQKGGDIDGEAAGDESGYAVSMPDANTVAVGAPMNDGNGTDAGHVRIFRGESMLTSLHTETAAPGEILRRLSGGVFTMEPKEKGRITYVVRDLSGGVLLQGVALSSTLTIDLSTQPAGIYMLEILSEQTGRKQAYRLVKP